MRITDRAAAFIDEMRSQQHLPEHFGVRLFAGARLNGQGGVQIRFSPRPLAGDEVSEGQGTRLFVAPEISGALDDCVLDVEGEPAAARLVIREE